MNYQSKSHLFGLFLGVLFLGSAVWAESMEMVTYYPASSSGSFDRLHANRATIGPAYSLTIPATLPNGRLLVQERLGVGTNNPSAPLEVFRGNGEDAMILAHTVNSGDAVLQFHNEGNQIYTWRASRSTNNLLLRVDSTGAQKDVLTVDPNSGDVSIKNRLGIGPGLPDSPLTISDSVYGNLRIFGHTAGGDIVYDGGPDSYLTFRNMGSPNGRTGFVGQGGEEWLTVRNDGRIGVGNLDPQALLDVVKSGPGRVFRAVHGGSGAFLQLEGTSATTADVVADANHFKITGFGNTTLDADTYNQSIYIPKDLRIGQDLFADQNLWADHNLFVGHYSPAAEAGIVIYSTAVKPHLNLVNTQSGASYDIMVTHPQGSLLLRGNGFGTKLVQVDADFKVTGTNTYVDNLAVYGQAYKPGGGSWAVLSDLRVKKNIMPLNGALDRLLHLRGVNFEWKESGKQGMRPGLQMGMVAQEVEKVFPEWVSTGPDGNKWMGFQGFEALTVEAIRELKQGNDALKTENEQLKRRLDSLEKKLDAREPATSSGR